MLINYMKEAYPNFLTDPPNITDLTTFYKAAKLRFDESEEFKEVTFLQFFADKLFWLLRILIACVVSRTRPLITVQGVSA